MTSRILLVIAGCSDIGKQIIYHIGNKYDKIIVHYFRNKVEWDELKWKDKIIFYQADLRNLNEVYDMVEYICKIGVMPTDIIHLAAGKYEMRHYTDFLLEKFEEELQIELKSLIIITQAFIPHMKINKFGRILIMLSECVGDNSSQFISYYLIAKFALLGLIKALDSEYAKWGINVNGLSPSMIENKFWENIPQIYVEHIKESLYHGKTVEIQQVVKKVEDILFAEKNQLHGRNVFINYYEKENRD